MWDSQSPSIQLPELLRPAKGTKHTPNTQIERELCLSVSCGGTGQQWPATGALGAADLGMAKTLVEVTINPTIEPPELTQN